MVTPKKRVSVICLVIRGIPISQHIYDACEIVSWQACHDIYIRQGIYCHIRNAALMLHYVYDSIYRRHTYPELHVRFLEWFVVELLNG